MAVIYTKIFSDGTKPYLLMQNEEFVRPLSVGTNWQKLRLSAIIAVRSQGAVSPTASTLMLGLCSDTKGYMAVDTANFIGCHYTESNTGAGVYYCTPTFVANGGNPLYQFSASGYAVSITRSKGVSYSPAGGGYGAASVQLAIADQGNSRRSMIACDIIKGVNWNTNFLSAAFSSATSLVTMDEMLNFHETTSGACSCGGANVTLQGWSAGGPVNPNESVNGYLNSFNLSWNKSAYPIEIYAIAVSRQA